MSGTLPDWLPELIETNGSWVEILGRLYDVFERDFKRGRPIFNGLPIWWDRRHLNGDPHEEGFWHLVTRDDKTTGDRLLDTPRAQRLAWCRAVLVNSQRADVLVFDYEEANGRVRTYLWGHHFDYVVILEKVVRRGKEVAFSLVTAFNLDGPSSSRRLQKKYDNRRP